MGGRGTFAAGRNVGYTYKTVGTIEGVKVLQYTAQPNRNKLPEEAHSSNSYILLDRNGVFHQYREYDDQHRVVLEIGYHFESGLSKAGESVLHIHIHNKPGIENHSKGRPLTLEEMKKYKKFFKGGEIMTGMTASDFIKAMYNCSDIEFQHKGRDYMLEMWRQDNGLYSARVDSIEKLSKNLFFVENLALEDCIEAFENANIFDGKTIYEAESEIEVLYG